MKIFRISGTVLMGRNKQKFTKELISKNKKTAEEKIYCDFGSKHKANRRKINIENIKEISYDDVTNPIVKGELDAK